MDDALFPLWCNSGYGFVWNCLLGHAANIFECPLARNGTLCTSISLHKRVVPFIFGMDFSVPQCFGWARERPYHHNWWRGRASLPFFVHSFSASTFWFLVYLSNQSYYLDRCVQPFLRILFSLGTPAKTLLKKCEMIHLRRLSGSLPVDSV